MKHSTSPAQAFNRALDRPEDPDAFELRASLVLELVRPVAGSEEQVEVVSKADEIPVHFDWTDDAWYQKAALLLDELSLLDIDPEEAMALVYDSIKQPRSQRRRYEVQS